MSSIINTKVQTSVSFNSLVIQTVNLLTKQNKVIIIRIDWEDKCCKRQSN
jgi:hypothetical protein